MTKKEYHQVSVLYQFLTKRFNVIQDYEYDGLFRCYKLKYNKVLSGNLETLKLFEELSLKDLFTSEHIESKPYIENYLNEALVRIDENRVCVRTELGQILLYYLVDKLENPINEILDFLDELKMNKLGYIREKDEGKIYVISLTDFDKLIPELEKIENFKFAFHLLAKTNSGFILRDWDENLEIYVCKIFNLLKNLKNFEFENLNL